MKMMNPQSASTMAWAAAAVTIIGSMVLSPGGQFISYIIAAVLALVPALFGYKVSRIVGALVLTIALLLAIQVYPAFKNEGDGYKKRGSRQGKLIRFQDDKHYPSEDCILYTFSAPVLPDAINNFSRSLAGMGRA